NPAYKLDLPAKDARDIAAFWKAQVGGLYSKVEVKLLTDAEATRPGVLAGLEWLERQVKKEDVTVLYLSGHGLTDPLTEEYIFFPYEADLGVRRTTMLWGSDLLSVLGSLQGKVLLFLDTCHAGSLFSAVKNRDAVDLIRFINELTSAENG